MSQKLDLFPEIEDFSLFEMGDSTYFEKVQYSFEVDGRAVLPPKVD